MTYLYYPDSPAIYFLTSRTLSIQSFPICCLKHLFYFIGLFTLTLLHSLSKISYLYYPDGSAIYFLTSRTLSIQSFSIWCPKHLFCCLLHYFILYFTIFIKNVSSHLSWWCWNILFLYYLIYSIFFTLLFVFLNWLYLVLSF